MERWETYYYQLNELLKIAKPTDTLLELGSGNGFSSEILRHMDFKVTTVDWEKKAKPTLSQDIRKLKLPNNSFDIVMSFQMLEHFPYPVSLRILKKMQKVTRKYALISLPLFGPEVNFSFRLPKIPFCPKFSPFGKPFSLSTKLSLPNRMRPKTSFEHQWEIGTLGYSMRKVKNDIGNCGFRITRAFPVPTNLYFMFFTLEKE